MTPYPSSFALDVPFLSDFSLPLDSFYSCRCRREKGAGGIVLGYTGKKAFDPFDGMFLLENMISVSLFFSSDSIFERLFAPCSSAFRVLARHKHFFAIPKFSPLPFFFFKIINEQIYPGPQIVALLYLSPVLSPSNSAPLFLFVGPSHIALVAPAVFCFPIV